MSNKTWRILGAVLSLSVAACTGCNNDSGGDGDGNGNGNGNGNGSSANCTGTFSGAVTGSLSSCELSALKTADGQVQYSFALEVPESGSVERIDSVVFFSTSEPKTGSYTSTNFPQYLGGLVLKSGNEYQVSRGYVEDGGQLSVQLDKIPTPTNPTPTSSLYEGFAGSATVQYVPPKGSSYTDTVTLKLTFK